MKIFKIKENQMNKEKEMKKLQAVLLLSILSAGLSCPSVAAEETKVKDEAVVTGELKSPELVEDEGCTCSSKESMARTIQSLEKKNQRLEHENFKLQTQILDLTRTAPEKQASPSTNVREDVRNLQVTMKEMVAEQKKFHRDFLRLALQIRYGMVEMDKEARELFIESLAELEDSSFGRKK